MQSDNNSSSYQNLQLPPSYNDSINDLDTNLTFNETVDNLNHTTNFNSNNNYNLMNVNLQSNERNNPFHSLNLINDPLTVDLPPSYQEIVTSNDKIK